MPEVSQVNVKRYILSCARIAVAILAMYLACRKEDWGATWGTIKSLNLVVVSLLLLFLFINQVIVATRWYLLLRLQSIDIGLEVAIKLTLVGFYYNNCLPGSVGGDVLRAWYVSKHTPKRFEAVTSVFIDRLIGLTGLLISAVIAYLLFPKKAILDNATLIDQFQQYLPAMFVAFIIVLAILVFLVVLPHSRRLLKAAYIYGMSTGRQLFFRFTSAVFLYCRKPLWLLLFVIMTLGCQTIFIFGLWLVGRELKVDTGFAYYLVFIPISWVIGMLPVSIGGVGVMEGTLKFLFKLVGVEGNAALVLALCQRFALLAVSVPGMLVHVTGAHAPKEFSVDCTAGVN